MLDSVARKIIDPPLNRAAHILSGLRLTGTFTTLTGFLFGVVACGFVYNQLYIAGLAFLILNRLCDGLDGAIARARNEDSDFGGYLDITLDFFMYAGFPFAFALGLNTIDAFMASSFVIFAMITTGVSFLAYAIIAAKNNMQTSHQGKKSFYFSNGLMEGTETILFLCLLCIFPYDFAMICFIFGGLCLVTTIMRIRMAYCNFVQ